MTQGEEKKIYDKLKQDFIEPMKDADKSANECKKDKFNRKITKLTDKIEVHSFTIPPVR